MFNLPITRSCGHQETVTITESLPPGKAFKTALAKIEKEESAKLCNKCIKGNKCNKGNKSKRFDCTQAIVTIIIWLLIMLVMGGICMMIFRY